MWLDLLLLCGGLGLLILGGEMLIRGASALAARLRVPPMIIGLTVVAFGTSTPELVVNLTAAWRDASAVGFGNIIGSNIANVGLLLGLTALIRPMLVRGSIVGREIPMMLLVSVAALLMAEDQLLTGRDANRFDRDDGLVLLLLFGVFLYYLVGDALRSRHAESPDLTGQVAALSPSIAPMPVWKMAALIAGGLAGLVLGGQGTLSGAVGLATAAGLPPALIALTLVAVGTSLPELATSVIAARRGQADLAIGNIVGSNIYNLGFIFGLTAAIDPIPVPPAGITDLIVMLVFSLALLPLAWTQRRINRLEGAALLAGYAGYVAWLAAGAMGVGGQ
ncbi:MAG: calcium/sodium antiporter [Planctomycetes bacterium]|jgi:cation:H+ antiporter|nr:calcium/sodium antiporter [Planctomycetota bacterium]